MAPTARNDARFTGRYVIRRTRGRPLVAGTIGRRSATGTADDGRQTRRHMLDDCALTSTSPNSILRVRGTLSRANGHLAISEPKTERSRRNVPLSPATVALLGGSRRAKQSSGSRRPRFWLRRASSSPRGAGQQSTLGRRCSTTCFEGRGALSAVVGGVGGLVGGRRSG
jgi:hypothetical protein